MKYTLIIFGILIFLVYAIQALNFVVGFRLTNILELIYLLMI